MAARISLNPFAKSPTITGRWTRTRWLPEVNDNLHPAFERLAKSLRLVDRARAEGVENRPHKDDIDLDDPQRQIVAEIQSGTSLLRQFLTSQLHDAEEKIRARMPRPLDVALAVADSRASVAEAKLAHGATLESMRLVERRRLRGLRKFKADNQLSRDAAYADEWLLPAATVFALIVAESIANAFIFKEAVDMGLVGGFALACLFGAVNVVLGFFGTGFVGLRLLGHMKPALKVLGAAFTAVFGTAGIAWNLLVAHYREALERTPGKAIFLDPTLATSPEAWLKLSTVEAWALLLLGVVVFVAAAIKGRGGRGGFTDPYWGYRAVDLSHRETETSYVDAQEGYKGAVRAAYDLVRATLRQRYTADEQAVGEILEIAGQAEQRSAEVRDSISEWINMGGILLRRFREENRAVRTAPAPAYFDTYPTFADLKLGLSDATALRTLATTAADIHAANGKALAEIEESLAHAKEQETKLFLGEIDEIEARAERRLVTDWSEHKLASPNRGTNDDLHKQNREAA